MKRTITLLVVLVAFVLGGCAAGVQPVTGMLYSDVKGAYGATESPMYSKVGEATATSILGIVATGDASIEAACKSAGITKIHHVDYHTTNILGIYATHTVYVYGK